MSENKPEWADELINEVKEVKNQVGKNCTKLDDMQGQITGIQGQITGIQGQITGMQGQITGIQGQIEGIHGQITGFYRVLLVEKSLRFKIN